MNDRSTRSTAWFRGAAVVLLLWGFAGCFACIQQFRLGADAMGPASDYDRALYASLPVWYNAVYAVAVGCGLFAAIALLARSVLAVPLACLSLAGVLIQFGWLFATSDIIRHKGAGVVAFPLFIVAVAAFAVWLARLARARGWIR
ncbi:hypothetical protein SAMN05216382_1963 [Sphingomonas palmae]|uniref:Sugar transporter n=1 Tax=Sphingomonas palmae TaxID=1855283 RepID=A0A1H7PX43_9SPHN|nr:hypothetical protein [Sphingomonas palmae]SEL40038.1 hypothetical protein SAMN05216382_1963 [Sphingomonas palmae]